MTAHLLTDHPTHPAPESAPGAAAVPANTDASGTGKVPDPALSVPPAGSAWEALSAAMTDEAPVLAERDDLTVAIAPGAGQGAPACLLPALARIEIDGNHLGVDPATADPARPADRYRYPTAWGLFVHECAHARHTDWTPAPDAPPASVRAAMLLEESRIEAAQIRRRPDDRHWLRAATTQLILADLTPPTTPATPDTDTDNTGTTAPDTATPAMTTPATVTETSDPAPRDPAPADPAPADPATAEPAAAAATASGGVFEAACAATLVLARVDAGILDPGEAEPVATTATTVLGATVLAELHQIWQTAHTVADTDADQMLELGRRWCTTVGIDPDAPTPVLVVVAVGDTGSGVAEAVRESCARVKIMVAAHPRPADPTTAADADRAEQAAAAHAAATATTVFSRRRPPRRDRGPVRIGGPDWGVTATTGTRPATDTERAAARVLGRALDTAGVRDRVATRTRSALPPGRLQMRGALAADAQRAAGAQPTAEPFTRTTRRPVPAPPLRLGVACDVSGSMDDFAGPVASTAWILAHAAQHTRVDTTTAAVIFGRYVRAIHGPGETSTEVTEFLATDNYEQVDKAIDALDGALDLARPGAARLLVIVSDGQFRPDPRRDAQTRINRLTAAGCGVLWLAPAYGHTNPLSGVTVAALSDPAATARAIGRAATTALRTAH